MKEKVKRADSVMVARLAAVWEARVRVPVSPESFFTLVSQWEERRISNITKPDPR